MSKTKTKTRKGPVRNAGSRSTSESARTLTRAAATGPGRSRSTTASSTRPLGPRPKRVPIGSASTARRRFEAASIRPLLILRRLPNWFVPITMGVLLLAGLIVTAAWAAVFLFALAGFLGWLVALSWPSLNPAARILRTAVVAVVLIAAIWRAAGNG